MESESSRFEKNVPSATKRHLLTDREPRVRESRSGLEDSVIYEEITSLFAVHQPQVALGQISLWTAVSVYPALNVFLWTTKRCLHHHPGEATRYEMSSGDNDIGAFMVSYGDLFFKKQHRTEKICTPPCRCVSQQLFPAPCLPPTQCQFHLSE